MLFVNFFILIIGFLSNFAKNNQLYQIIFTDFLVSRMNFSDSIKRKMKNMPCVFLFGGKYRVFLWTVLFSFCSFQSQIYISNTVLSVREGTIVYTDSILVSVPKKVVVYVAGGTEISGFREYSNMDVRYVETVKSPQIGKQKIAKKERLKSETKVSIPENLTPKRENRYNYTTSADEKFSFELSRKSIPAITSGSSYNNFSIGFWKGNKMVYNYLLSRLSEKIFSRILESSDSPYLDSFRTRPPPFSLP